MTPLLRAHLLALVTTRAFGRLAAVALAAALFLAVSFLGVRDLAGTTADDLRRTLGQAGVAGLVAFLAGAAAGAGEDRHGTLPWLVVAARARGRLVAAQALALAAAWGLAGAMCAVGVLAVVLLILAIDGSPLPEAGVSLRTACGVLLYAALAGAAGAGWGHLLRSQALAVAAGAVVLLAVEPLAASLLEPAGRWGPSGAGAALVGADDAGLLPAGAAAAVLAAWTGACVTAGCVAVARRDVR